jgi:nucleotide-binding universal stress UspA family protein
VVPLVDVDELAAEAAAALDKAAASVPDGVSVKTQVRRGDSAEEIIRLAKADADVIVIGTRGHGDAASLVIGSVSHEVIRRSPVPVLVVNDAVPTTRSEAPVGAAV